MAKHKDPSFNIYAFKSWLSKQPNFVHSSLPESDTKALYTATLNSKVESRLGLDRLTQQIEAYNPGLTSHEVARFAQSFKDIGGTVIEAKDLSIVIEINEGKFTLPKIYTKLKV